MLADLSIDPVRTTKKLIDFIKEAVHKAGFAKVVIGVSGGLDSAVSCFLAAKALGSDNVIVGLFPYGELNKEGIEDAKLIIRKLVIPSSNVILTDIKSFVEGIVSLDLSIDDLRKGNIMVRMRMILLYDLAKKYQALVLGTENKTEYLLGYFTRFGDEASDIEPIKGLYKTQLRQLAKYLKLPTKIIQKVPSAGMWSGQTDEGELGFSYEDTDQILYLFFDKKKEESEIIKSGFKKEIVEKVIGRLRANEFKHKLPYKIG
jgi:NAD+ synthase